MNIEFSNVLAVAKADCDNDTLAYKHVRRVLKTMTPGAKFMKAHKLYLKDIAFLKKNPQIKRKVNGWDGKVDVISPSGEFNTGLLPVVLNTLWRETKTLPRLIDKRFNPYPRLQSTSMDLRYYQSEGVNAGLTNKFQNLYWPRGIFQLATGAGKTELAVAMYETTGYLPTLFIVHLKTLAWQAKERFEKYGYTVGRVFDGVIAPKSDGITIATIQTLMRNTADPQIEALLSNTQQVFFDEAHQIAAKSSGGNWFVKCSDYMPKAFYRWGLTATPFMKDEYSNILLQGATGNVLKEVKTATLIKEGYLVDANIKIIEVKKVTCPEKWPDCYDMGVTLNPIRTKLTAEEAVILPKPLFVLTTQVAHAKILERALTAKGVKTKLLIGEDSQAVRQKALDDLSNKKLEAIVCTTIFDQGFDYTQLKSIIVAGGGKSVINTIQRLGRGLRNSKGKKTLQFRDFMDLSSKTLKRQSNERIEIYKQQGFKVIT